MRKFIPWDPETIPLSKSNVQMYDQCPYNFKRKVVDGVKLPASFEMDRGTKLHAIYTEVFERLNYDMVMDGKFAANITEELAHEFSEWPEDETILLNRFVEFMIKLYDVLDHKELIFPIYMEKYLYDKKNQYYGTFDRLDAQDDDSYIVIDWKTGSYRKWNERNYRFEMMGYKHLIESQLNIKVKQYAILFLGDEYLFGPEIPHPSTVKAFYNRLNRVRGKIKFDLDRGKFERKRQMCNWCSLEEECLELSVEQVTDKKIFRNGKGRMKK